MKTPDGIQSGRVQKAPENFLDRDGISTVIAESKAGRRNFIRSAFAAAEVSVCRIPLDVIHQLGANSPRLHRKLMEKWQSALKQADDWLAELNFGSARQRVLHFIHKMHEVADDGTATLFGRDDMGAMMDLKLETVSREVTALVRAGVMEPLDKHGRHYKVLLPECLQEK